MSFEEMFQLLILSLFVIAFIYLVIFLLNKTLQNQRKIERKIKKILNIPPHPLEVLINQEQSDDEDQIEIKK
jgi:hypothetical protein